MPEIEHPAGTVKRSPNWPDEKYLAVRTIFNDTDYPGWTSWIRVSPSGSEFVTPASVADWPLVDVVGVITASP